MASRGDDASVREFEIVGWGSSGALALSATQAFEPPPRQAGRIEKSVAVVGRFAPPARLAVMEGLTPPIAAAAQAPVLHKLNAAAALLTVLVPLWRWARARIVSALWLRHRRLSWTWASCRWRRWRSSRTCSPPARSGWGEMVEAARGLRRRQPAIAGHPGPARGPPCRRRSRGRASERRGLLDPLRRRHAERGTRFERALTEGVPIGRTNRGELAMIGRGSARSGCHVLVAGATGAGRRARSARCWSST